MEEKLKDVDELKNCLFRLLNVVESTFDVLCFVSCTNQHFCGFSSNFDKSEGEHWSKLAQCRKINASFAYLSFAKGNIYNFFLVQREFCMLNLSVFRSVYCASTALKVALELHSHWSANWLFNAQHDQPSIELQMNEKCAIIDSTLERLTNSQQRRLTGVDDVY